MVSLRMERQFLTRSADEQEYLALYRDLQPGLNVYWNGFGEPPTLSFRTAFDDKAYNKRRQLNRQLIKGRFAGGNLGWIIREDLELFACLYRKPLTKPTEMQLHILEMIEREGPLNIQQMKEESGLLVKEITPALHRLQEAFLVYEDQYDGEWDRGWYPFGEMFPDVDLQKYTKAEALAVLLQRFAYRMVWFDAKMVKSFYKVPDKEIKAAIAMLIEQGILVSEGSGYLLQADAKLLKTYQPKELHAIYAVHRNDVLYKSNEPILKEKAKAWTEGLSYDCEPLQYLLIDGEFHGAVVGHFRNGPYDLNDVVCDLPDAVMRREEILDAVKAVNFGVAPKRFMGEEIAE